MYVYFCFRLHTTLLTTKAPQNMPTRQFTHNASLDHFFIDDFVGRRNPRRRLSNSSPTISTRHSANLLGCPGSCRRSMLCLTHDWNRIGGRWTRCCTLRSAVCSRSRKTWKPRPTYGWCLIKCPNRSSKLRFPLLVPYCGFEHAAHAMKTALARELSELSNLTLNTVPLRTSILHSHSHPYPQIKKLQQADDHISSRAVVRDEYKAQLAAVGVIGSMLGVFLFFTPTNTAPHSYR